MKLLYSKNDNVDLSGMDLMILMNYIGRPLKRDFNALRSDESFIREFNASLNVKKSLTKEQFVNKHTKALNT